MGVWATAVLLSLAVPVVPVVPAYPGARTEAPPTISLRADGTRLLVTRQITDDPVDEVRRKLVVELGAGRVLSLVDDGQRRVLVVGAAVGQPSVVAWRQAGEPVTHLLVERLLGTGAPAGPAPDAATSAIPMPGGTIAGLPLYPYAEPSPARQPVAGGPLGPARGGAVRFTTTRPFAQVAAFYRALLGGAAIESHAGGTDWLELTSGDPEGATVRLLHEPQSPIVEITFFPRER